MSVSLHHVVLVHINWCHSLTALVENDTLVLLVDSLRVIQSTFLTWLVLALTTLDICDLLRVPLAKLSGMGRVCSSNIHLQTILGDLGLPR